MDTIATTDELEAQLGENIKQLRLLQNIDRQTLCTRAGISVSALRHLESGSGATVKTLIRVIRALGRLDWIAAVAPRVTINPLHKVRGQPVRQRASRRSSQKDDR